MIKINTNENAFPPSPGVLKALASFDGQSLRQYSSLENNALRNVLAEHLAVDRDQIIVGNGSDDILALAFLSFFNSADPILFLIRPMVLQGVGGFIPNTFRGGAIFR